MKPKSAKAKGRTLQNEVVEAILEALLNSVPSPLFEKICESDIRPAIMGDSGCDIKLSSLAMEYFPFSIECKNQERINIWEAIEQAKKNTVPGTHPAVVFRRNRMEPWVALPWKTFLELVV
jgi:hypothetical protein